MSKAGILVYDNFNKKILTISNQFDENIGIPKGSLKRSETHYDAAFRELFEETGLLFTKRPQIKQTINLGKQKLIFIVNLPNGSQYNFTPNDDIKIQENIYNITWRTLDDLILNLNKTNFTIRKGKGGKNRLLTKIHDLFI